MQQHPTHVHYVSSTHWDREWYQPFQHYRRNLVRLLDEVVDALQTGRMTGPFTCDGQVVLLDDYLEIRREKHDEVRELVRSGRLILGPWYVLPDEFLVSGESLIRNLEFGRERAAELGGSVSAAGFLCDLFGHNSQMPQIFAAFGIRAAMVWRGVDHRIGTVFRWVGADGTELPAYRFGKRGYCDYTYQVRRCNEHDTSFDRARAEQDFEAFIQSEIKRGGGRGPVLVFDGGDHLFPDWKHYDVIRAACDEKNGRQVRHSTLDAFLGEMADEVSADTPVLAGELREPRRWSLAEDAQFLIPGCTASRIWIKLENAACESLLCQWAEPFAAFARLALGAEYPTDFLREAWKWLLQNHPHDSICGCSIDQVHEDMRYRFSQSRQIAERLTEESLHMLAAAVPGEFAPHERRLVLFNPLFTPRCSEVLEFDVEIPVEWLEFTEFFAYEPKPAFRLFNEGKGGAESEIAYQRLGIRRRQVRVVTAPRKYPKASEVHVVRVAARVDLPALGFAALRVRGIERNGGASDHLGNRGVPSTRHPAAPGLRTGQRRMENEFLAVEFAPDGTFTLSDKNTGRDYPGLLAFEDDLDIGDGWYHGPHTNRRDIVGGAARIELLADTPLLTRFVVHTELRLPAEFDAREDERSVAMHQFHIRNTVTLRAGARHVDIETEFANTAADHRLRAFFPTGADASEYLSDSPFDVVRRPIALRSDNHEYQEVEVDTKPQQTWTAVHDDTGGLALVTGGGLLETAVHDRPDRPIALTLLRATRRTKYTNGEPGGLMLGEKIVARCRIVPLNGAPDRTALFRHAQDLAAGIRSVHLDACEIASDRAASDPLPENCGLLEIRGPVVASSLRIASDRLAWRGFNPGDETVEFSFVPGCGSTPGSFEKVSLRHAPTGEVVGIAEDSLHLSAGPKEIFTWAAAPPSEPNNPTPASQ